jgi:hypothetical protein
MPSDPRIPQLLALLARPAAAYRSHVATTRERLRVLLASDNGADRIRHELGAFGATRIDVSRFAELRHGLVLDALSRTRLERASQQLMEIEAATDDTLFTADVAPGDSLRVAVARALARAGRAFGAEHVAELVRSGRYEPERHDRLFDAFPFEWWNRVEREHAPPLVVSVDGADLRAGALAELLDGGVRIVLVVRGACTPAPLARLVTPGTLVMQTRDAAVVARVASFDGPAIAAIMDHDAAQFRHDPADGRKLWQRLTIISSPETPPRSTLGGVSPRQQREELLLLEALAERPALPDAPVEALIPGGAGDPADRLTAWLLTESGLATHS